jgi:hypothetical protein
MFHVYIGGLTGSVLVYPEHIGQKTGQEGAGFLGSFRTCFVRFCALPLSLMSLKQREPGARRKSREGAGKGGQKKDLWKFWMFVLEFSICNGFHFAFPFTNHLFVGFHERMSYSSISSSRMQAAGYLHRFFGIFVQSRKLVVIASPAIRL